MVALDTLGAGAALFNAVYFTGYGWRRNGDRARRMGAAALALVGAAAFVDSACSQVLLWTGAVQVSPGLWALARALPCAAAVCISLIVLRRLASS